MLKDQLFFLKQTKKKLDNNNFSRKWRKQQRGRSILFANPNYCSKYRGEEGGLCQTYKTFWCQVQTYLTEKEVQDTSKEKKLDNNDFSQKWRKLQSGRSVLLTDPNYRSNYRLGEGGLCQTCVTFWRQIQTYLSQKEDKSKEKNVGHQRLQSKMEKITEWKERFIN